ncbi:MAG TPA: DUF6457 domain-containing protein [Streptosporangiaceae bacterium]|jgi:hypothetical protein|nr:DUF6457 domain-containing protein [Streptosporangiaceae bacterium]
MTTLDDWTAAACAELGIDPAVVDVRQILDLARDAAHQVDRPAAPVTAFLLGLAVGGGMPADQAAARLSALAEAWPPGDRAG